MRFASFIVLLFILTGNLGLWSYINRPILGFDYSGKIQGVSFSPYREGQSPLADLHPSILQIEEDLKLLSNEVENVRTYSAQDGLEQVPLIAKKYGMKTMVGVWIGKDREENEKELANLFSMLANKKIRRNITHILIGNEVLQRKDITLPELVEYIRRVQKKTSLPVSTAETWHNWLKYPELGIEVDFVAAHVLPYWEGIPLEKALDHLLKRYEELQTTFKRKKILLTEVGWPSDGRIKRSAVPDESNQARFLRQFLNFAQQKKIDYHIMEAFDQPWKRDIEGGVGAYWGIFDADRQQKFPLKGAIVETPAWPYLSALAILLALVSSLFLLFKKENLKSSGHLFFILIVNGIASLLVWVFYTFFNQYLTLGMAIAWSFLLITQVGLVFLVLSQSFDTAEIVWTQKWKREFGPSSVRLEVQPKISIHLPMYNEPVEMVKQTLNALSRLNYKNYEVLIIDNNTKDPLVWHPIRDYCAELGEKFRFYHLDHCPGFKAGALNFALRQTSADTDVVAVIDSDYIVFPDWLIGTVPYFENSLVSLVQAPQDYYDGHVSLFKDMVNWEYDGFFHMGMVQRNERNAIIQHGTMTMIRKKALDQVKGWGEWCITEDAELGLRLFKAGYESVYINHVFGQGVTPDNFSGYKSQRFRWAYGAIQILKKHWRSLIFKGNLTAGQRYHFLTGWLPWIGDAVNLAITIVALGWTAGMIFFPKYFDFPLTLFLFPTLSFFFLKLFQSVLLYVVRVKCGFWQKIGATIAGLSLTYTIAHAVLTGMITSKKPFVRTPKLQKISPVIRDLMSIRNEIYLFVLLIAAAVSIVKIYGVDDPESKIWAGVLVIQALPYLATLLMALLPKRSLPFFPCTPLNPLLTKPPS